MRFLSFCTLLTIVCLLTGCEDTVQVSSVERENLFTLDIGKLEDQLALFGLEGGIRSTDVAMRDGLFYISDSNGGKILRFNSYGDLLFMIYNEETNPPPLSLRPLSNDTLVTRWAISYPLLEPGQITVDSRKHIYVRDRLPYERHSFDSESRSLLDSVILHFDGDGRFVTYLGREGIGGSPFPRIDGLYTSIRDELVVVCRLPAGWDIYWFDSNGFFLFLIQLKAQDLPIPPDRDNNIIPSMDMITVAPDERKLYVKLDYYIHTFDESTNMRTGIEIDSSVIWEMNAEDGVWERPLDVPFYEYTVIEQNRRSTTRVLYSLLGAAKDGHLFLYFPVEGGYSILIITPELGITMGRHQGFIRVDNNELQYNVFDLSTDGILSGLLVDDWQVKLVWWRTDKLLEEVTL